MTYQGDPGENALAKRINRTIKEEFNCRAFLPFDLVKWAITKTILAYNQLRPYASCDYLTPRRHTNGKARLKSAGKNMKEKMLSMQTS